MYVFICTTAYGPLGPKFRATLLARAQEKNYVFGIFFLWYYVIHLIRKELSTGLGLQKPQMAHWAMGHLGPL